MPETPREFETQSEVFSSIIRDLEGNMLTVADAFTADKEQREAVKSIIRNNLWSNIRNYTKCLFPTDKHDSKIDKSKKLVDSEKTDVKE